MEAQSPQPSASLVSPPQHHQWLCLAPEDRAQAVPGSSPDPPALCQVAVCLPCPGEAQAWPRHSGEGLRVRAATNWQGQPDTLTPGTRKHELMGSSLTFFLTNSLPSTLENPHDPFRPVLRHQLSEGFPAPSLLTCSGQA